VEFSRELRDQVIAGDITVSFRLWRRPQARAGGRYLVGPVQIEVDSLELVPFSSITPADVTSAGEPDLEALRRRAAHAGPIADDTLVLNTRITIVSLPKHAHDDVAKQVSRDSTPRPAHEQRLPC